MKKKHFVQVVLVRGGKKVAICGSGGVGGGEEKRRDGDALGHRDSFLSYFVYKIAS